MPALHCSRILHRCLGLLVLLGSVATFAQPAPGKLKAGFAERDITPQIGMEQPGGYVKSFHTSFHDACKVRAAVFDDGARRVAMVGIDALIVPRALVLKARAEIERRFGIPGGSILIGASHSHSSGPIGMVQPGEYDHASPLARRLAYEESSAADPAYLDLVLAEIIHAVGLADRARVPAQAGFGVGHESSVSFNRRFRMKNGLTFTHPGKGNPDIIAPAGPIDPDVGVVGVWDASNRLLGCVVHFACHATTNPGGISANWIYYLEQTLRGALGADVPVVFLQGCCGDITQVNNLATTVDPAPEAWARLVGGRVGAEAARVLLGVARTNDLPVRVATKTWKIPRRKPSPERLRRSIELVQKPVAEVGHTDWAFAKEIVMLDALIQREPSVEVEVQAIQVGPAVFVTNPAEFFVELGLQIKKGSPFSMTFPVELANGCVGYVPTAEAFGKNGGGYETRLTSYSNLEVSAGQQFVDAALALVKTFQPGPIPARGPAPVSKAAWTYGALPPELD